MEIKFCFPDLGHELYDHKTKIAYIFCMKNDKDGIPYMIEQIESYITHAWLHYLIQKVFDIAGAKVSLQFDKLYTKVIKWNEEVYRMLY